MRTLLCILVALLLFGCGSPSRLSGKWKNEAGAQYEFGGGDSCEFVTPDPAVPGSRIRLKGTYGLSDDEKKVTIKMDLRPYYEGGNADSKNRINDMIYKDREPKYDERVYDIVWHGNDGIDLVGTGGPVRYKRQ